MMMIPGQNAALNITAKAGVTMLEKHVDAGFNDPTELEQARQDLKLYYDTLRAAQVHVPEAAFFTATSTGQPGLRIRMPFIRGTTAFESLEAASTPADLAPLTAALTLETMKIVRTMYGFRPVGYDTAVRNFVVAEDSTVYCVDITPPRLMFSLDSEGQERVIPYVDRLINYPGRPTLPIEQEAALRHFYYTPIGTLEHLFAWTVTAATYQQPDALQNWSKMPETKAIMGAMTEVIKESPISPHLGLLLERRVESGTLDSFMDRRLRKARFEREASGQALLSSSSTEGGGRDFSSLRFP
jgi:hypothetical protein